VRNGFEELWRRSDCYNEEKKEMSLVFAVHQNIYETPNEIESYVSSICKVEYCTTVVELENDTNDSEDFILCPIFTSLCYCVFF
jgi:hypothetical protein